MAASEHKIVCIIISIVIAWGIYEVRASINAWYECDFIGINLPFDIWLTMNFPHILAIFLNGLLLCGIHTENSSLMYPWLYCWAHIMVVGFLSAIVLVRIVKPEIKPELHSFILNLTLFSVLAGAEKGWQI